MTKTPKPTTLGARILAARRLKKLSARAVATRIGVDQMSVYRWEWDQNVPSVDTLRRLAAVLNIRPGQLLDD